MQIELFYEDEYDAIRACIQALGGAKGVGHKIWPDKSPDKAGEHLLNATNPNHAQVLSFSHALLIMEWAREIGCHVAMSYVGQKCHYTVTPIEPEDQKDALQREFIQSTKHLSRLAKQIEGLSCNT